MMSVDSLRDVLELEKQKRYADKAVIGGLDRYLHKQAGKIRQNVANPQLLASFAELNLANSNYSSWDTAKRKKWITSVFDWLDKVEKEGNSIYRSEPFPSRHSEPFALCHSEGATRPKNLAQDKLREESHSAQDRLHEKSRDPSLLLRVTAAGRSQSGKKSGGLDSAITAIKGITPTIANKFAKLDVKTVHDLLYFFPRRYIDYSQIKSIAELEEGEEQTIIATVWQARVASLGNRQGTEAIVGDETGNIRVVWFNQPYLAKKFTTNTRLVISGKVSTYKGQKVFESPEWELLKHEELIHTGRLVPVYPLTQGLYPRQVRKWTKEAMDGWAWQVNDFLRSDIKKRCQLLDLPDAITQIHYPENQQIAERTRRRLAFDELFLLQLGVLSRKQDWQESQPGNAFDVNQGLIDRFLKLLPFALTRAQERVLREILADLKQPKAMARLLQGEVGSGKTVIATLALLTAFANGYQGALMAPTEVLAEQHFSNICAYLSKASAAKNVSYEEPFTSCHSEHSEESHDAQDRLRDEASSVKPGNISCYEGFFSRPLTIALLIGSLKDSEKRDLHYKIKQGEIDIVIGTHALIQKEVEFSKLGLVVVDEQHRFGVLQRSALRQKGFNPHVLVMTATPIPRTMALTLYGDLDLSVIDELPPGRQRVRTSLLAPQNREKAYAFIHRQVDSGGQAFIIYPLVEESEILEAKAATTEYERLSQEVFPDLKMGLLHGQMRSSEKEEVMRRFRGGGFDILVSTSVVEVGVDIPKATVMLIEGAERFGLSQLHQFRGRVGRDKEQSYCILIPEKLSPEAKERLKLMEKIHDGFILAEKDLELRGPGEFFGTHQSGLPDLKVAKLSNLPLLELARKEAVSLFQSDHGFKRAEHQLLSQQLSQIWSKGVEWS